MRLRTDIWVSAFLRANQSAGRYGAVLHKGAEEAGAVHVVIDRRDGTALYFAPAPGPAYDERGERRFIRETPEPAAMPDIVARFTRRRAADPDLWVVEIEDRTGDGGITPVRE
jgi:hypothetical protein